MQLVRNTLALLILSTLALTACGGDDGPSIETMSKFVCDCDAKEEETPPTAEELAQCRDFIGEYLEMVPAACHDCIADKVDAKTCSFDSCESLCPDDD